jgi:hypothetical protein
MAILAVSVRGMGILPMRFRIFTGETPVPQALPVALFRRRYGLPGMSLYELPASRDR